MSKLIKSQNYFQMVMEKKGLLELPDGGIQIEGYASTKDKDRGLDIVEPTAFKSALAGYMTNPIVLLQHNADKPIGVVTDATIDQRGLYIKAKITEDTDGIFSKLKNWVIRAFSIGYRVKDYEDVLADGDDGKKECVTIIKDLELFEISLVSIPMNAYALAKSMAECFTKDNNNMENLENMENVADVVENVEATDGAENVQNVDVDVTENNNDVEQVEEIAKEYDENDAKDFESEILDATADVVWQNDVAENANIQVDSEQANDQSENSVETTEDDGKDVVDTAVELKSLSIKNLNAYMGDQLTTMQKAFNDKLLERDNKITALENELAKSHMYIEKLADCIDELDTKMANTIANGGYTYSVAKEKKTAYSDLIKKMQNA